MTNSFFITGCVRSGTTLLEKLLCNHPTLSVLSQPLPMLYIKLKQAFLKTKNIEEYFALSNYVNETRYSFNDFDTYLNSHKLSSDLVNDAIESTFSGQLTSALKSSLSGTNDLAEIYSHLMKENSHNATAKLYGCKEVLCEEFVPYFINNNIKVIHIVRDPRDVASSIKKGKGEQYIGNVKPLLFELRNWRKSAQLAIQCQEHKNFLWIRYEDLVLKTEDTLKEICTFLNISDFKVDAFEQGIKDQQGNLWSSNSSFENSDSIVSSKSIGRHKNLLSQETNDYIMSICLPENTILNKEHISSRPNIDSICNFKEPVTVTDEKIAANYSTTKENLAYEINRINLFFNKKQRFEFCIKNA
jgi:hypothetical protein